MDEFVKQLFAWIKYEQLEEHFLYYSRQDRTLKNYVQYSINGRERINRQSYYQFIFHKFLNKIGFKDF